MAYISKNNSIQSNENHLIAIENIKHVYDQICFRRNFWQKLFWATFDEKGWFWKCSAKILAKKLYQYSQQEFLSPKRKLPVLLLIGFTYFSKIDDNCGKIPENANENNGIQSTFLKSLNHDNSLEAIKIEKIFPYSTLDGLFNAKTQNPLRWIYRSVKIVWTRNPVEYIVPPPSRGVRTITPPGVRAIFLHSNVLYNNM